MLAPVIRLDPLSPEEMLVLTEKLADMHAGLYGYERSMTQEDLALFLRIEYGRIGADTNITPREVIRDFIELLDILYQHPGISVNELMESDAFSAWASGLKLVEPVGIFPANDCIYFEAGEGSNGIASRLAGGRVAVVWGYLSWPDLERTFFTASDRIYEARF